MAEIRLIDANALKETLHNFFDGKVIDEPAYILRDVFCHIDNAPTIPQATIKDVKGRSFVVRNGEIFYA